MLGCAVIASVLASRLPRWTFAVAVLALLGALPYVLSNEMRPLLGVRYFHGLGADHTPNILSASRDRLYFGDQHLYLADSYLAAARAIAASGCEHVALDAFVLHYEYPMLAALRTGLGGPVVHYVGVRNRTAALAPCGVICLGCAPVQQKHIEYAGPGIRVLQFDRILVFLRQPANGSAPSATDTTKSPALKTADATSGVSTPVDSDPPAVDLDPCGILPEDAVRDVLSGSVTHSREKTVCRYTRGAGQIELAAFSPNSYYSRQYETLAAEGMGSLQFREPDHALTIVLDRDVPVLAYLHTANALNIDRNNPPPTAEDYIRMAKAIRQSD